MHVLRLIFVLFLIVVTLFTYGVQARGEFSDVWQQARPEVLQWMDSFYAEIRGFIAGTDGPDGINDHAPGVNFDEVITMEHRPAG
jgi:hypothetical protein